MYTIEVGRGLKGVDSLATAVFYYKCINTGKGYKKRLCMDGIVLRRVIS